MGIFDDYDFCDSEHEAESEIRLILECLVSATENAKSTEIMHDGEFATHKELSEASAEFHKEFDSAVSQILEMIKK